MAVPETGDYLVTLAVPADAAETRYDVAFTIGTSASQPMTPAPGGPGATRTWHDLG